MARNFIDRVSLSEKDIEDYLFDNPESVSFYAERDGYNFRVARWIGRQVCVPSGIIDLLGVTEQGVTVVVEVKLGAIDGKAISQCARYAEDLKVVFGHVRNSYGSHRNMHIFKLVIGSSIDKTAIFECYATGTCWIEFSPTLSLSFGRSDFSDEYYKSISETYLSLANENAFVSVYGEWDAYCDNCVAESRREKAEAAAKAKAEAEVKND